MKTYLPALLAVVGVALGARPADAWWWDGCAPCPWVMTYQTVVVTRYYPQWQPRRVPCVVPKVTYREQLTPVATVSYRTEWEQQTRKVVYYIPEPRVVERDIVVSEFVPVLAGSPITGCAINYYPRPKVQRISAVVCDYRPEVRDQVTNVPRVVPEVRTVEYRCYVPEVTYETSWTVRYDCVMVPYQQVVNVPVCVPCWPGCW